jgi:hypothetical protein
MSAHGAWIAKAQLKGPLLVVFNSVMSIERTVHCARFRTALMYLVCGRSRQVWHLITASTSKTGVADNTLNFRLTSA